MTHIRSPQRRRKLLREARKQFKLSVTDALHEATAQSSPVGTAEMVWGIPTEAASHGFTVAMCQDETGWSVTLSKQIDDVMMLEATSKAVSLLEALVRLVDATTVQMDLLEAVCREDAETETETEQAAA